MPNAFFPDDLPEILYWGRDSKSLTAFHEHPYFQLEAVISGYLYGSDIHGDFSIGPGQYRLFAPGIPHRFFENSGDLDFFSVKFRFPAFHVANHRHGSVTETLLKNILRFLPKGNSADPAQLRLLAGQLYLLLFELHRDSAADDRQAPELLRDILTAVTEKGHRLNVNLLAEELGLSLSQLKYRFRKVNNTDAPNLKCYIDSLLIDAAKLHLEYSDLQIGTIAKLLRFIDYYTFSRFFKHRTGMTPGTYRRNAMKHLDAEQVPPEHPDREREVVPEM